MANVPFTYATDHLNLQEEDIAICIFHSALHTFNISLAAVFHLYPNTKTTRIPGTTRSYCKDNQHEQDLLIVGGRTRGKKTPNDARPKLYYDNRS